MAGKANKGTTLGQHPVQSVSGGFGRCMRFVSKAFYASVQGNNWAAAPSLVVETARRARQGSSGDNG